MLVTDELPSPSTYLLHRRQMQYLVCPAGCTMVPSVEERKQARIREIIKYSKRKRCVQPEGVALKSTFGLKLGKIFQLQSRWLAENLCASIANDWPYCEHPGAQAFGAEKSAGLGGA
jgi:hypothetical protein